MSRTYGFDIAPRIAAEVRKRGIASYIVWQEYILPLNLRHHSRGHHTAGKTRGQNKGCRCSWCYPAQIKKQRRREVQREILAQLAY